MASSKAVNRPVDEQLKERDINNKLQLYGIYNGKSRVNFTYHNFPVDLEAFM